MLYLGGIGVVGDVVWVVDLYVIWGFDWYSGKLVMMYINIVGVSELGGVLNFFVDGENLILLFWFDGDVWIWDL